LWAQLRALTVPGAVPPQEALRRAAERRHALVGEILQKLEGESDQQARFLRRVERLASYVPVREERALWQLALVGSMRGAILRRGELLARHGVLDRADDIFFLRPEELASPDVGAAEDVSERREEHARWSGVVAPERVGGEAPLANEPERPGPVINGAPGSRGVARGRARVIVDLADADRLEPGDVLVCGMTAPPWTPLFAVASAVVTDTGELGSHPAIAAREYGIACVVGTRVGTTAIRDGAQVVVDGTAGTVEIVG
jgi:pyruvate,water dikinase